MKLWGHKEVHKACDTATTLDKHLCRKRDDRIKKLHGDRVAGAPAVGITPREIIRRCGDFRRRGWERNADESDRSVLSYVH